LLGNVVLVASDACHVLEVGYGSTGDEWNAVCSSLPPAIVEELREASRPGAGELDMGRRVRAVADHRDLARVLIVWNGTPFPHEAGLGTCDPSVCLAVPSPWLLPFEPHELSSGDPTIEAIAGAAESPSSSTVSPSKRSLFPGRLSYLRLAQGVVFGLLAAVIVNSLLMFVGGYGSSGLECCCLPCCTAIAGGLYWSWFRGSTTPGQWLIVPGGVVVRRRRFGSSKFRLLHFSGRDSVLMVHPLPPGWRAVILRDNTRAYRTLTLTETLALLRVWQGPCVPMDPAQFDDLR